MRHKILLFAAAVFLIAGCRTSVPGIFDVTKFGASPNGKTLTTASIQKAVNVNGLTFDDVESSPSPVSSGAGLFVSKGCSGISGTIKKITF